MQRFVTKALFVFCSLSGIFSFLHASSFEDQKKVRMIQDLETIKHLFEVGYAPAEWKKEYVGWDLNEAFEHSKHQILSTHFITTKQFQQIVRQFVNTLKDYHVDVLFFSTEASSLPFNVKGAEGRYFIDWIDPIRLPVSHYGLYSGDELLEFDGHPIAEVIANLLQANSKASNPNTDTRLAELKLTTRSGMLGDFVPQGPLMIKIRSIKTGKISSHQLRWSYTPEQIRNPLDFLPCLDYLSFLNPKFDKKPKEKAKVELRNIFMANPSHQTLAEKYTNRDGGIGSRKSFVPILGDLLWSIEDHLTEEKEIPYWYAYIYRNAKGNNIGYIRIPHYVTSKEEVKEFGEILHFMQEETDALVIDQLHNIGGFVRSQYALISMLIDHPIQTPYHRIKITQQEAMEAYKTLEIIKLIDMLLELESDSNSENHSEENHENEEDDLNYQEVLFLKAYCELILEDWNKGKTLTRPTPILGVDKINPHLKYRYSKPILMLIDEMDFSGGDFMPAILQDHQRVVLFGMRTAGAGGYVFTFQFPNSHGIALCSYTASIAERSNLQKIENLGVTPDIEYRLTPDDVQGGYKRYAEAVNQTVQSLLEK